MKKYLTKEEFFKLIKNSKGEIYHFKKYSHECGEMLLWRYNDVICAREIGGGLRNTSFIKRKIWEYDYPEIGIHKGIEEIDENKVLKRADEFLIYRELEVYRQTGDKKEILGYIH